jgi:hypothetical protein
MNEFEAKLWLASRRDPTDAFRISIAKFAQQSHVALCALNFSI